MNGTGFIASSYVNFNGTALPTTFVSVNQLTAVVPITSLATAGQFPVSVTNPLPGGGTSNSVNFLVIGSANAGKSTLTVSPSPANNILADGMTAATLIVTAKDAAGNLVGTGGAIVVFTCTAGTANLGTVTDVGNGTYTTTAVSTTIGTCTFTATINSGNVGGGTSVQVIFVVGNTITVSSNTLWSALTGGTGTGGKPSAADKIIVGSNKTLTVDVSTAVANSVTLGTGNGNGLQGQLTFNSGSQLIVGTLSRNSNQTCNITMTNGGILVVTTSWTTGLTLVQGTGSINFGGAGSQTLPSDVLTYNNLATVGNVTAKLGVAVTVNGNLTTNSGTTLDVSTSNYGLTVKGAWSNSGTFTPRSGTVTLNGTSNQSMSGATTFYNLTLSNATGLTISNDETITNTLTLTNGDITTGSSTIIAYSGTTNATVTANANSYVNGNLRKYVSMGTSTVKFEVGTAANVDYTPASITFTGVTTAGTMTVNATSGTPSFGMGPISTTQYINVYWHLTGNLIAGGTYTVDLTWINSDRIGGAVYTGLFGAQYVSSWGAKLTPTTRNSNDTKLTGAAGFGYFILGY